jgi:hypothetical protein
MLRVESLPVDRRSSFDSEDPASRYGFLPESAVAHPSLPIRGVAFPPRSVSEQVSKDSRSVVARPRSPVLPSRRRPLKKQLPPRPMQPLEIKDLFLEVYPVIQPAQAVDDVIARSPVNVGAYTALPDSDGRQVSSERRPTFVPVDMDTEMFVEKPLKRQLMDTPPTLAPAVITPPPAISERSKPEKATAEELLAKSKPLQDGNQFLLALDINMSAVSCAREELKGRPL